MMDWVGATRSKARVASGNEWVALSEGTSGTEYLVVRLGDSAAEELVDSGDVDRL
jgi:hypothetical protein